MSSCRLLSPPRRECPWTLLCALNCGDAVVEDEWLPGSESEDCVWVEESKEYSEFGVSGGMFSSREVVFFPPGEGRDEFSLLFDDFGLSRDFQFEREEAESWETPLRLWTVPVVAVIVTDAAVGMYDQGWPGWP